MKRVGLNLKTTLEKGIHPICLVGLLWFGDFWKLLSCIIVWPKASLFPQRIQTHLCERARMRWPTSSKRAGPSPSTTPAFDSSVDQRKRTRGGGREGWRKLRNMWRQVSNGSGLGHSMTAIIHCGVGSEHPIGRVKPGNSELKGSKWTVRALGSNTLETEF
jgi:hypothetical protein